MVVILEKPVTSVVKIAKISELKGGLQFGPWPWEAAMPAKFQRAGRATGRGNGRARPWAHLGPVGGRCWGGNRVGVGARRKSAAATVARLRR
jgi:hypothetical protein